MAEADAHAISDSSDGIHFSYAGYIDSVSVEAIYGTMDQSFEREVRPLDGAPRLLRFAISAAALERAVGLVTERGPPPRIESSSEESSSSTDDDQVAARCAARRRQGEGTAELS